MASWKKTAKDVCTALTMSDPFMPEGPKGDNNMLMASLLGMTTLLDCPAEYKEQASKLNLDGEWGPTAKATHLLLAKLCNDGGEAAAYYVKYD